MSWSQWTVTTLRPDSGATWLSSLTTLEEVTASLPLETICMSQVSYCNRYFASDVIIVDRNLEFPILVCFLRHLNS